MRINLVTPFSEKDRAKALGARWDAKLKVWYVVDPPDLAPFMQWIPDLAGAQPPTGATPKRPATPTSPARQPGTGTTPNRVKVAHCGCAVLPWEPCPHTPH